MKRITVSWHSTELTVCVENVYWGIVNCGEKKSHTNYDTSRAWALDSSSFSSLFCKNDRWHLTHDVTVLTMHGIKGPQTFPH